MRATGIHSLLNFRIVYRLLFLCQVIILTFAQTAHPQFNGNFDIERHFLEIENFLDWKAYQSPNNWKYEWAFAPNRFGMTVGSIDLERFYSNQDIRLEMDIGQYFTILYRQQQESFWGQDPVYREAEMRFGEKIYASLIGFPAHEKKNIHVGYAVAYGKRHSHQYLQLSYLQQYLVYNEKNAGTDKNDRDSKFVQIPLTYRLEGQLFWKNRLFIQIHLHQDLPTEFEHESPLRTRKYDGSDWIITADWLGAGGWTIGVAGREKREHRVDDPAVQSTATPDLEQDLVYRWYDVYYSHKFNGGDQLTVGWLDSSFENDIASVYSEHQYLCRLTTAQAYAKLEHFRGDWFRWLFSLQAGDAQLDKSFEGMDEDAEQQSWELKAGLGFIMAEQGHYRFFFNSTWDLDIFTTRQWDGGNVQVQYLF